MSMDSQGAAELAEEEGQAVCEASDSCVAVEPVEPQHSAETGDFQPPEHVAESCDTPMAADDSSSPSAEEGGLQPAPDAAADQQEIAAQPIGGELDTTTSDSDPMQQAAAQDADTSTAQQEPAGDTAEAVGEAAEPPAVLGAAEGAAEVSAAAESADSGPAAEQLACGSVTGADSTEGAAGEAGGDPAGPLSAEAGAATVDESMQGTVQEAAVAAVAAEATQPGLPAEVAAPAQPGDAPEPAAMDAAATADKAADSSTSAVGAQRKEAAAEVHEAVAITKDATDSMLHHPAADQDAAAPSSHGRQPSKAYFVDGMRALDVEVDCGPGLPCKLLHVTMDVSALEASTKPFLGGFKHKQAGTVYHHASIQAAPGPSQQHKGRKQQPGRQQQQQQQVQELGEAGQKLTRETQTIKESTCSCQTVREAATQMAAPGLLLDCSGDRVLTPRPYVTAEVVEQRREAAALTIQRFSRGWFARKRAGVLRGIKAERDAFLAETAADAAQAAFDHKRREVERRTHPLSKADFVLLEAELESWRQQQTAAIKNAGLVHQEEQAALQLLLAKETRLLHTLDRLRVAAHQERRASGRQRTLGALAQPKIWSLSNGKKVLVHTPLTVRAAELQQLYRGLTLPSLSLDERLDVLLHVKWVAKEWDSAVTRELVELIDREADLLNRGRSPKTLDGLRKRIAGLFLTCCQQPVFNPEAARLRVNAAVGPHGPEAFEYVLE